MILPTYDLPPGVTASNIAHLYRRVSSEAQLKGHGLERQTASTKQWVEDHGLVILNSYEDRGVSAFRGKNRKVGELGLILRQIEAGIIKPGEHLIIESVDRISRQVPREALKVLGEILDRGIIVHALLDRRFYTQHSVDRNFSELFALMMSMSRANEESRVKSERIRASFAQKRDSDDIMTATGMAWVEAVVILGPDGEPVYNSKGKPKREWRLIPDRAAKIVWIFEQIAAGISLMGVAQALNKEGYPTWGHPLRKRKRKQWDQAALSPIVTGKAVLGHFTSNTVEYDTDGKLTLVPARTREDYYPPVVTPELWQRANDVHARRVAAGPGGSKGKAYANLFSKMIRCSQCGGAVVRGGPTGYPVLLCQGRRMHTCENGGTIPYHTFENNVLKFVTEINLVDKRDEERAAIESRIATISFEIDKLDKAINDLLDMIATSPRAKQRVAEHEAKIAALEADREKERKALDRMRNTETPTERNAALRRLWAQMGTKDLEERFKVRAALNVKLQEVIERIEQTPEDRTFVYLRNSPTTRYAFYAGKFLGVRHAQERIVGGVSVLEFPIEEPVPAKISGKRRGWTYDNHMAGKPRRSTKKLVKRES